MNKRLKALMITTLALTMSVGPLHAKEVKDLNMYVGQGQLNFTNNTGYPISQDGTNLVPLNLISTQLGYKVDWTKSTKTVTVHNKDRMVILTIGSKTASVNGKNVQMDTVAQVRDNRTYVPLRFITENMGAKVEYKVVDGRQYVLITLPGGVTYDVPASTLGKIEGTAGPNHEQNMQAIRDFFGENLHSNTGDPSFNPLGGSLENTFVDVSRGTDCEVEITIFRWNTPSNASPEVAQKIAMTKPVVKEVFKFYLPTGGEKLYKIVDDGYNDRLPNEKDYLNVDLKSKLGSDGRSVVLVPEYTRLVVKIGYKK